MPTPVPTALCLLLCERVEYSSGTVDLIQLIPAVNRTAFPWYFESIAFYALLTGLPQFLKVTFQIRDAATRKAIVPPVVVTTGGNDAEEIVNIEGSVEDLMLPGPGTLLYSLEHEGRVVIQRSLRCRLI